MATHEGAWKFQHTHELGCTQFGSYPHYHPTNSVYCSQTVCTDILWWIPQTIYWFVSFCKFDENCLFVHFQTVRIAAKSAFYLRHACLSVCVYQLRSHWIDFRENWYWRLSWNSVEKCKIWAKPIKIHRAHYLNVILRYLMFLRLQTSLTMSWRGWNMSEVNSQNLLYITVSCCTLDNGLTWFFSVPWAKSQNYFVPQPGANPKDEHVAR